MVCVTQLENSFGYYDECVFVSVISVDVTFTYVIAMCVTQH